MKKNKKYYIIQKKDGVIWYDLYKDFDLDYIKKFYKALLQKQPYMDFRIIKIVLGKD